MSASKIHRGRCCPRLPRANRFPSHPVVLLHENCLNMPILTEDLRTAIGRPAITVRGPIADQRPCTVSRRSRSRFASRERGGPIAVARVSDFASSTSPSQRSSSRGEPHGAAVESAGQRARRGENARSGCPCRSVPQRLPPVRRARGESLRGGERRRAETAVRVAAARPVEELRAGIRFRAAPQRPRAGRGIESAHRRRPEARDDRRSPVGSAERAGRPRERRRPCRDPVPGRAPGSTAPFASRSRSGTAEVELDRTALRRQLR